MPSTLLRRGLLAALVCLAAAAHARADEFVSRLNATYADIAQAKRSDLVLLPLIAKMDPAPRGVGTPDAAALLVAASPGWAEAASWAQAPNQVALIAAVTAVTKETDWRQAFAFGLPYGVEGVPSDLVRARLYTELGDPPTLAAAQHLYLPALDRLAALVNVEAGRLTETGKVSDAIDLLIGWSFFARQIMDRQFHDEASWGLAAIAAAQERIRDVAYIDFRAGRALDSARLAPQIKRLDEQDGYLNLGRMRFPVGDRLGTEQIIARVYSPQGGVDDRTFAPTLSRLGSSEYPLRLFSEAARWRSVGPMQAGQFDAAARAKGVYDDFASRWTVDWYDARMALPTEFSRLDRAQFAPIDASTPDMVDLLGLRQLALVEIIGTRYALAHLGHFYTARSFAPVVTAIRPRWIQQLPPDPYNPDRFRGAMPPLQFMVPMRDQDRRPNENPTPLEMEVVTQQGQNFAVRLRDDTFLLYSFGSDNGRNFARRIQNTASIVQGADYLIFPPIKSLYRQHLIDVGELR